MSNEKPIYTAKNPKSYDEKEFYDAEIVPLVDEIVKLCKQKDIPYLMSFQCSWNETCSGMMTSISSGKETHSTILNRAFSVI